MIQTITTVDARNTFSRLINRVAFGQETLVITRRGMKLAALIPFQDFLTLVDKKPEEDWLETLENALNPGRRR